MDTTRMDWKPVQNYHTDVTSCCTRRVADNAMEDIHTTFCFYLFLQINIMVL